MSSQPSSSFYGSQSGPKHDKSVAHPQMRLQYMLTCAWHFAVLHGVAVCTLRGIIPVTRKPCRTRRWSSRHQRAQALPHRCTLGSAHSLPPPKKAPVRTCQMREQVQCPYRTVNQWRKCTANALRSVYALSPLLRALSSTILREELSVLEDTDALPVTKSPQKASFN